MLTTAKSVESVVPEFLAAIAQSEHWDIATAWILQGETGFQHHQWVAPGFMLPGRLPHDELHGGRCLAARALEAQDVVYVEDLSCVGSCSRAAAASRARLQVAIAVPLSAGDDRYGAMEFMRREPVEMDEETLALYRALGADISRFLQAKLFEGTLQRQHARLVEAQRIAGLADWHLDPFTGRLRSEDGANIIGLPKEEARGTLDGYLERVPVWEHAKLHSAFRALMSGEMSTVELEHVLHDHEGTPKTMAIRAASRRESDGKVVGLHGTIQDITAQRRLETSARITAAAIEQAAEAVMILDVRGRVVQVNPAFTHLTGHEAEQAVGRRLDELLHRSPGKRGDAFFHRGHGETPFKDRWEGEAWAMRPDGSEFPVLLSLSAVRDDYGATTHHIGMFNDISAQREYMERLAALALHDGLTGLPNRLFLMENLQRAMLRHARSGQGCAVGYMDLDRFKAVNDQYGHDVGDELLKQVAGRLRGCLRANDLVARLGGDEFVILLEDVSNLQDVETVAQKVVSGVGKPYVIGDTETETGASLGIALFPQDAQDPAELLKKADAALYRVKAEGRNGWGFWTPELS